MMIRQRLQEYFSFTKKERVAVLVLIGIVLFLFFVPHFISKPPVMSEQELTAFQAMANPARSDDSLSPESVVGNQFAHVGEAYAKERVGPAFEPFYFDPNTIGTDEWKRFGLRERTIGTIQRYLSKGGRFYKPDDLKKIYGLRTAEYERIHPYIQIKAQVKNAERFQNNDNREGAQTAELAVHDRPAFVSRHKIPETIDINTADTTAWIALPGIGSKLASRIVQFRQKLGGFYDVEQVSETYGLADSVFQRIRPFLKPGAEVQRIDINTADMETLKSHPYIRWALAKAIISYREQHGPFKAVEQLQQISAITPEQFRKLRPYLGSGFP